MASKKVVKKTYLPNSKAFKLEYEGGGIGYGADTSQDKSSPKHGPAVSSGKPASTPIGKYVEGIKANDKLPTSFMRELESAKKQPFDGVGIDYAGNALIDWSFRDGKPSNQDIDRYKAAGIEVNDEGRPILTDQQESLLNKGLTLIERGIDPDDLGEVYKPILHAMTDVYEDEPIEPPKESTNEKDSE